MSEKRVDTRFAKTLKSALPNVLGVWFSKLKTSVHILSRAI